MRLAPFYQPGQAELVELPLGSAVIEGAPNGRGQVFGGSADQPKQSFRNGSSAGEEYVGFRVLAE
jgi:hypothetical protein